LASTSDYCILDIASKVRIELGTSLDMIDNNLILLKGQEQARVNIFLNTERESECLENLLDMDNQPDAVDQTLMDILKMTKEDCERRKWGKRVASQEVHFKTTAKPKVRFRKGKNRNK
jgi:hypothetical protein